MLLQKNTLAMFPLVPTCLKKEGRFAGLRAILVLKVGSGQPSCH